MANRPVTSKAIDLAGGSKDAQCAICGGEWTLRRDVAAKVSWRQPPASDTPLGRIAPYPRSARGSAGLLKDAFLVGFAAIMMLDPIVARDGAGTTLLREAATAADGTLWAASRAAAWLML